MNDTLIFLVLGALALIFKWLTRQAPDQEEKPEPPSPNEQASPSRPPPQSEEERIRRFLEALGAPPGTRPPPPVRPRRVVTPAATPPGRKPKVRPSWAQPLPPLVTTPEDFGPPAQKTTPLETVASEIAPPMSITAPPLPAEVAAPMTGRVTPVRVLTKGSLSPILRSREKIRQAIMLREILGPPRGLAPFGQFQGQ